MKCTGFYSDSFSDYLKITVLKKNAFKKFSFIENKEELENISKKVTDSFVSDLLLFPQNKIEMSKWCDKINIIGDFFDTFDYICENLSRGSKETGLVFIPLYYYTDDYMEDGIFIYLGEKTICSEIIIDGMRISDKFDNVILERQFVNPSHDLYIDLDGNNLELIKEFKSHYINYEKYWNELPKDLMIQKGCYTFEECKKIIIKDIVNILSDYSNKIPDVSSDKSVGLSEYLKNKIYSEF